MGISAESTCILLPRNPNKSVHRITKIHSQTSFFTFFLTKSITTVCWGFTHCTCSKPCLLSRLQFQKKAIKRYHLSYLSYSWSESEQAHFLQYTVLAPLHTHTHAPTHAHAQTSCFYYAVFSRNGKQSSVTSPPTYSLIPSILWGWMMITGKQTETAQKNTPQAATKACPPNPKHSFPCEIRFQSSQR